MISGKGLFNSLKCVFEIITEIQNNSIYTKEIICEPFLAKYKFSKDISGYKKLETEEINIRNIVAYVDKNYDLIDISKKLKIPYNNLILLIKKIEKKKIIKKYL